MGAETVAVSLYQGTLIIMAHVTVVQVFEVSAVLK